MSFLDVQSVCYSLPDGRPLLRDISLRVGKGDRVALLGNNGAGKTTLLNIISGEISADSGAVYCSGSVGVMSQFLGGGTVRDALLSVAPQPIRSVFEEMKLAEMMLGSGGGEAQYNYAETLMRWGDVGGYEVEVLWDLCTTEALGISFGECWDRPVSTLSGGEQKRLILTALFMGKDDILLLDEPDNFLDIPGKRWLEEKINETDKSVLYISHDRELLARTATAIATVELSARGNTCWAHSGGFRDYLLAREERWDRIDELRRRWEEDRLHLREVVRIYRDKAAYNSDMASRYRAACARLRRFEAAGMPEERPRKESVEMRLTGGRTGKKALVCEQVELTGLTYPFDFAAWYGDRVAVLGPNGVGKSHFLRLVASVDKGNNPVSYTGSVILGSRVYPGWFAQNQNCPELLGRTLLDILHCGEGRREGLPRQEAIRVLSRYGLARAAERYFENLSGGQKARFQILLLELEGATMLLLDEPTDNLDLESAEALQEALRAFAGTVLAVTHDRWFARDFDRFLVFSRDGLVLERDRPVWE